MAPARIVCIPGSLRAEAGLYKVYPSINLPTSNPQCSCSEKFQCRPLMLNSELKKMRATMVDRSAVSASISSDGHYAFVEFATIYEANKDLCWTTGRYLGRRLKSVGQRRTRVASRRRCRRGTGYGWVHATYDLSLYQCRGYVKAGSIEAIKVYLPSRFLALRDVLRSPADAANVIKHLRTLGQLQSSYSTAHSVYAEYASTMRRKPSHRSSKTRSLTRTIFGRASCPWKRFSTRFLTQKTRKTRSYRLH